ncbi:hypothetical protein A249_14891 [Pseudomonas syringae pv. actinidiae ICMP 18804]|nr:hypothetical protein A249_14891 [Pseudomonas syringae pv. actinidiae ICMP 18804]EPN27259.1 hypothetical protein A247_10433 [Pseudomonas syringae pv. actinidiae ICMP 19099]EPN43446.1 hypothetical protein A242_10223 [Pseudomonas syringae pv. actinidiae ICMP 19095]
MAMCDSGMTTNALEGAKAERAGKMFPTEPIWIAATKGSIVTIATPVKSTLGVSGAWGEAISV